MAVDARLRLMFGSQLDAVTLSTTPAAEASLPATNLQLESRARIMRITDDSAVIKGSSATAMIAQGFALAHHNLESDATWRVRLYDDEDQGGSVVYDTGVLDVKTLIPWGALQVGVHEVGVAYEDLDGTNLPKMLATWFDAVEYKSFQVDIDAPSNATIDIARLMANYCFRTRSQHNFSYGAEFEWVDDSEHRRTAANSLATNIRPAYRRVRLPLDWLDVGEAEWLSYLEQVGGKASEILVGLQPDLDRNLTYLEYTFIGKRMTNARQRFHSAAFRRKELVIEET